jgi:hypothetical protein
MEKGILQFYINFISLIALIRPILYGSRLILMAALIFSSMFFYYILTTITVNNQIKQVIIYGESSIK